MYIDGKYDENFERKTAVGFRCLGTSWCVSKAVIWSDLVDEQFGGSSGDQLLFLGQKILGIVDNLKLVTSAKNYLILSSVKNY